VADLSFWYAIVRHVMLQAEKKPESSMLEIWSRLYSRIAGSFPT
jgi:hypothetical protein